MKGRPLPAGRKPEWTALDLRRALLRRANLRTAGRRSRRFRGVRHAGVPRRAIRRLGHRAAASLARHNQREAAQDLLRKLATGRYYDELLLAIEILDRLTVVWVDWSGVMSALLCCFLRHPWDADRLARAYARLLVCRPAMVHRLSRWAVSESPLRRRAAAMALLPRHNRPATRGLPAARAMPVLKLLLEDPEPHPWVQPAVGQVLVHFAERAPRTIERLLANRPANLSPAHLERARKLMQRIPSAS